MNKEKIIKRLEADLCLHLDTDVYFPVKQELTQLHSLGMKKENFKHYIEKRCNQALNELEPFDKDKCSFDWVEFHAKLDIAVAHMIEEKSKYPDTCLPSKTTIMELMTYSYEKVKKGGCFQKK